MSVSSEPHGESVILRVTGPELGADRADEVRASVMAVVQQHAWVGLDLSQLEFMDSSGLGVVVSMLKALRGRGELHIFGVQPRIEELFRLTGLNRVFTIDKDQAEALHALEAGRLRAQSA